MILSFEQVGFRFPGSDAPVLAGINIDIAPGRIVGVLGRNGSGKSTLLNLAAGLALPTEGTARIPIGSPIPIVFQDYRASLFPQLSALDNIALPSIIAGHRRGPAREQARALIDEAGMRLALDRRPDQLSGGQAQLVALLRALQLESPLVLFDEPASALDMFAMLELAAVTSRLLRARRSAALFVSHSLDEALLVADEILILAGKPSSIDVRVETHLALPRNADLLRTEYFAEARSKITHLMTDPKDQIR